jgi:hypothetical protein
MRPPLQGRARNCCAAVEKRRHGSDTGGGNRYSSGEGADSLINVRTSSEEAPGASEPASEAIVGLQLIFLEK